jgi:hypothetical protein
MGPSPETIRLYNVDPGGRQLSINLQLWNPKTASRLRRGAVASAILIGPGLFYDVCAQLKCSLEEAVFIANNSPEVKAHKNAGRLLVREHPPTDETVAEELAEQTRASKLIAEAETKNPPDPPDAIPAGVDPVAAGLPADTPKANRPPSDIPPPPSPEPAGVVPALPPPPESDDEADTEDAEPAPVPAGEEQDEPSTDWRIEKLEAFAAEHDIDLGKATSKTTILKKIQKARGK